MVLFVTPYVYDKNLFLSYEFPKILYFRIIIEFWIIYLLMSDKKILFKILNYIKDHKFWILGIALYCVFEYINCGNKIAFIFGTYFKNFGLFTILHLVAFYYLVKRTINELNYKFFRNVFQYSLIITIILMIIIALYQSMFTQLLNLTAERWIGTFGQPNFLASLSLFTLPYLIENTNLNNKKRFLVFRFISIFSSLILIFFSQSRIVIFGVVLYLSVKVIVFIKKIGFLKLKSLLIIIVTFMFIGVFILNSRIVKVDIINDEFRFKIWEASLEIIKERPLTGVGFDNTIYYLPQGLNKVGVEGYTLIDRAHNEILDWFIYLGIPISFVFIILFFRKFVNSVIKSKKISYFKTEIISCVFFLFYSLVNNNGIWNYIWIVYLLGFLFSKGNYKDDNKLINLENSLAQKILKIILIGICLLFINLNAEHYFADINFKKYLNTQNIKYLERAYKLKQLEEIYWQKLLEQGVIIENKIILNQKELYPETKEKINFSSN